MLSTRKMSERKAWTYLEKRWAAATTVDDHWVARVYRIFVLGLCGSVEALFNSGAISIDTHLAMELKIQRRVKLFNPGDGRAVYAWPMTKRGALSRASFCRKQARLLSKKGKTCR